MKQRRTAGQTGDVGRRWVWRAVVTTLLAISALLARSLLSGPPATRPSQQQPVEPDSTDERSRADISWLRDIHPVQSAVVSPQPAAPIVVAKTPPPFQLPAALPTTSPTPLPIPSGAPIPPVAPNPPAIARSKPHRVPFAALAAWSKPGLCSNVAEARAVREQMTSNFSVWEPADGGKFYLDPRLSEAEKLPVLADLQRAELEVKERLGLLQARPLVFVYADQALMKASACINENAVAFYDGALHVVVNRADVAESVRHEYTHHALFSSGFVTPAWAQEGIAMAIAGERWWRAPQYVQALIASPFGLEEMDRSIPYKLPAAQALAFYVQSAASVECLMRGRNWALSDLVAALRSGRSVDSLTYDLPELEQSTFFSTCFGIAR